MTASLPPLVEYVAWAMCAKPQGEPCACTRETGPCSVCADRAQRSVDALVEAGALRDEYADECVCVDT